MATAVAKPPQAAKQWLESVKSTGRKLPGRYVAHGPEGAGKSTLGAYTPHPLVIQTQGETGLETLIDSGRLPPTPHVECNTWHDLLTVIQQLHDEKHEYRTLVVDTLNGAERLCHEDVCRIEFKDDWGEKGFTSYQRGYEIALTPWRLFLESLDQLRLKRTMSIMLLCHTKIAPYANPEGPDYDRFTPDLHRKTWGLTHRWADAVLFLNFYTMTEKEKTGKIKGRGGQERIIYTTRHATYDAKNRHGLPEEISAGNSGKEAWDNLTAALKEARQNGGA